MLRITFIFLFFLSFLLGFSQTKNDSINIVLNKYLVKEGLLEIEDTTGNNLYIEELLEKDVHFVRRDSFGVYKFSCKRIEDAHLDICICLGDSIDIFALSDINLILHFLIELNKKSNELSDAKLLSYVVALSNLYYSESLYRGGGYILDNYGKATFWFSL